MLMRHLIALDNLKKTLPPTEEDQKLALLHANSAPCLLFLSPVHAIVLVGFILNSKMSKLDLVQDIQFLRIQLHLDLGRALKSKAREIHVVACACEIYPPSRYCHISECPSSWAHSIGSSVPEAITRSLSFFRSDKPVYSTTLIRPVGSCQPTSAMAGPIFSYIRNPNLAFLGGLYNFYGPLYAGVGCPYMGDAQISGTWTRLERKLHINCLELELVIAALHHWISVPMATRC